MSVIVKEYLCVKTAWQGRFELITKLTLAKLDDGNYSRGIIEIFDKQEKKNISKMFKTQHNISIENRNLTSPNITKPNLR